MSGAPAARATGAGPEPVPLFSTRYAVGRLVASLLLMTIGNAGMYAPVVVLPLIQAEFGISRSEASLPYTLTMLAFGAGGILMGHLADRRGVMLPSIIGTVCIAAGFVLASLAPNALAFTLVQGLLIGLLGCAATFSPLIADISHWFTKHRGMAMAVVISGNYLAGAIWPLVFDHFFTTVGWRQTYVGVGIFCLVTMLPLSFVLRRRATLDSHANAAAGIARIPDRPLGLSQNTLQWLLVVAGVACCVAMSMPQVHIVAYCGDLGYGPARGAEMLSLMLGFGIVSRLASGWIADRIGGLRTLLLGSVAQGVALVLFIPFDGLWSLYLISALFGLFQGGIVPSYTYIVREFFPASQAGSRVGVVMMATLVGMALGGWMSGAVFDLTGSYQLAFVNGVLWNLLNVSIAVWLLRRHLRLAR